MKRLYLFICVTVLSLALLFGIGAIVQGSVTARASQGLTAIDAMLGQPLSAAEKVFGKSSRTDPSEYGFSWKIFNQDYKKFAMAGVQGDSIVAFYTNMPNAFVGNKAAIGMDRNSIRAILGQPITSIQSQNTIYVIPNTDEKDVFAAGDHYYTVFYDKYAGNTADSFLIVRKTSEEALIGHPLAGDDALAAAYARESFDLLNSIRAVKGKTVLKWSQPAADLSLSRSTDMRERDYFDHYTPDGKSPADLAKAAGIDFTSLGENIACGHRNAILAHEALLNSPGHRENMLSSKYTLAGTGTAFGGKRSILLTCTFLKPDAASPTAPAAPAENQIAFSVSKSIIYGLSADLDVGTFLSNDGLPGGSMHLYAPWGEAKTSGTIATGDILEVFDTGTNQCQTYTLVLYGDVNADGKISLVDLLRIQKHLLGTQNLSGAYMAAADASRDDTVSMLDILRVQKQLLGLTRIDQNH